MICFGDLDLTFKVTVGPKRSGFWSMSKFYLLNYHTIPSEMAKMKKNIPFLGSGSYRLDNCALAPRL